MENNEKIQDTQLDGLTQVKDFAKSISLDDLKGGEWFARLLTIALKKYREEVDAEYFQKKYPGLPPDAVVDQRIELAKKYAALEGGSSAAAYTAAVAATIGSSGGASPLTIPAGLTAFAVDLGYTSFLQLRLAYDISILYGKPLDYDDPEDLHDLITLAFGIKTGEAFSGSLQKMSPEAVRVLIKSTIKGSRLEAIKALPVVGKYLLQRNIIKMAIPVFGIGLGSGINYFYTGSIWKRAKKVFRLRGAIEEAADQMSLDSLENSFLFLQVVWLVIQADKEVQQEEALYLRHLLTGLEEVDVEGDIKQKFETTINFDEEKIINQLKGLPPEFRAEIYDAACVASVVDGKLKDGELQFLEKLAKVCDTKFSKRSLSKLMNTFHGQ